MNEKNFYVYIMASRRNGTLYIGVTSDLPKRLYEHQNGLIEGVTKEHNVKQLVYYERHENSETALQRERNMKEWKRAWKVEPIEKDNPNWFDLSENVR